MSEFEVVELGCVHRTGRTCHSGWCSGGFRYPAPCKCGGLIHAEVVASDGDKPLLEYVCERCGENFEELF